MNLLERMICLHKIRRATRKERYREALDLLSHPSLTDHPAAAEPGRRVFDRLMTRARLRLEDGDLAQAREALTLARQAGHIDEPGAGLMARLTTAERDQSLKSHTHDEARSELREEAEEGTELAPAHSAIACDALEGKAATEARERALSRIRQALEAGDDKHVGDCLDAAISSADPALWHAALRCVADRFATRCRVPEDPPQRRTEAAPTPVAPAREESDLSRFMLRVEEGPEALVLTEETIHLGNARNPDNHIAVMANISSNHASIRREISFHGGISYVLRAKDGRNCDINGERASEAVLNHGDEIRCGDDVALRFTRPDPGSATALIEITRGYHVDEIRNVLLMKGPGRDGRIRISGDSGAHLRPRRIDRTVWLYLEQIPGRRHLSLVVEADDEVEVDGSTHARRATVSTGSYVCCGLCRFQIGRVT